MQDACWVPAANVGPALEASWSRARQGETVLSKGLHVPGMAASLQVQSSRLCCRTDSAASVVTRLGLDPLEVVQQQCLEPL